MQNLLLSKIESSYKSFSKGQKKIADYILAHYDKAAFMTANLLGKTAGISESTVVRFATEMGYNGYPELQKELQEMVRNRLTAVQRMEVASSRIGSDNVIEKVLTSDIEMIRSTLSLVSREQFSGAVETINNARKIYIIGVRSSASLASFIAFYFHLVYENVVLVDTASGSEIFEHLFRIDEQDVCLAISFPRYSKQTINALRFVSGRKAKIIAITDSESNAIAALSDYLLIAKSDMTSFVDSLVAPLSLINALIVAATLSKRDEVSNNFMELETIWDRYQVYEKPEEATQHEE